ncbi:hypothetical protein BJV74DRAFT_799108 [Russula compacta]|nr:hypothetical protein BJV74DRAFT_799108 [Russula compacta]
MFLLIDPTSPSELSSVLQPRTDLKDAANPQPLKRIIQLAADIMDAAEAVKANKERCLKLARIVGDRVPKICDIVQDSWNLAPPIIKSALDKLEALLVSISSWMRGLAQGKRLIQVLKRVQVKRKIEELQISLIDHISILQVGDSFFEEVRHAIRLNASHGVAPSANGNLVRQVRLTRRLGIEEPQSHPSEDGDGYPFIHRSDIVLHGIHRGTLSQDGGWWENTREASIGGRLVLIKTYECTRAAKRWNEDIEFLKSVWDPHLPQLFGISRRNSSPLFIALHDTGRTDLRAFVAPYIQSGHLLHVAAVAARIAGLSMLSNTGRWPAIYGQMEYPSLAMLSSLTVNNRGNVFGSRYPGSAWAIGDCDSTRRAGQLANQIAGSILLCGVQTPTHTFSTILADLRDAQWTPALLRELRASMVSWPLDDRSGLFSNCSYGDIGFVVPDPVSKRKRTFTAIGNVRKILGPQQSKVLGVDEPFRTRQLAYHAFEGEYKDMVVSEVAPNVTRYTFAAPSSISYQEQFSLHEKARDAHGLNASRWQSVTARISTLAREYNIPRESMILVSTKFVCATLSPPPQVHLFFSYEDYVTSYWSYDAQYKPVGERQVLAPAEATMAVLSLSERRGFYIQFIPEDFEGIDVSVNPKRPWIPRLVETYIGRAPGLCERLRQGLRLLRHGLGSRTSSTAVSWEEGQMYIEQDVYLRTEQLHANSNQYMFYQVHGVARQMGAWKWEMSAIKQSYGNAYCRDLLDPEAPAPTLHCNWLDVLDNK